MANMYLINDLNSAENEINNLANATQKYYESATELSKILNEVQEAWRNNSADGNSVKEQLEKCITNMNNISNTLNNFGSTGRDLINNIRENGGHAV